MPDKQITEQTYRFHKIIITEGENWERKNQQLPSIGYNYEITGDLISKQCYNFKDITADSAIAEAQNIIDKAYEGQEEKAKLVRYFIQKHYESFSKYLQYAETPAELIPVIASNLTVAATQKEIVEWGTKVRGTIKVDASTDIVGSICINNDYTIPVEIVDTVNIKAKSD